VPSGSLEAFLDERPEPKCDACAEVLDQREALGPLVVEAVGVGGLIKRARTFAELRPRWDRIVLPLLSSRDLDDPRVTRTERLSSRRYAHFVYLRGPEDVDGVVRQWLVEAYEESPD